MGEGITSPNRKEGREGGNRKDIMHGSSMGGKSKYWKDDNNKKELKEGEEGKGREEALR